MFPCFEQIHYCVQITAKSVQDCTILSSAGQWNLIFCLVLYKVFYSWRVTFDPNTNQQLNVTACLWNCILREVSSHVTFNPNTNQQLNVTACLWNCAMKLYTDGGSFIPVSSWRGSLGNCAMALCALRLASLNGSFMSIKKHNTSTILLAVSLWWEVRESSIRWERSFIPIKSNHHIPIKSNRHSY